MRKYKRIASIFVAATLTASLFAGCQKSPEKEIVSNKDMDNMIEQAQDTQSSTTEVAEVAKDYDTYQTDIKDDSLHVTVHADAQVDIPDTSQLSIFRVQQMQFDQAFLDQVRTTLFGEQTLYDGTCLSQLTKADYESEIQAGKDDIAEIQNNNLYSDDDKEVMIQERQSNIDECQAKYETAPEAINYTGSPSDNQIHSISELVSNNPSNEYYSWQSEFDGANASIFYGINDASNGSYQSLYLQNNENYGNLIRYRSSKLGYINVGSSVMSGGNYSDAVPEEYKFAMEEAHWVWPADEDMPIDKISEESGMAKEDFIENTKDVTTISEADARQKAEALINEAAIHTNELVSEHEIMQQAHAQAQEIVELATQRAQEILDKATTEANEMRAAAISYTDDNLGNVEDILSHSIDIAAFNYEKLMTQLQDCITIIQNNRAQLYPVDEMAQVEADHTSSASANPADNGPQPM